MIYCWKCGQKIADDSVFCEVCGEKQRIVPSSKGTNDNANTAARAAEGNMPPAVVRQEPVPVASARPKKPVDPPGTPSEVLVFVLGIVSIVLSTTGIPGLVLSLIARPKYIARENAVGPLTGKAKVGKLLATIALFVSIAFTVSWVVSIIGSCVAAVNAFSKVVNWIDQGSQWF